MSGGGGEELATLRSDNGEQQEWRYGGRGGGCTRPYNISVDTTVDGNTNDMAHCASRFQLNCCIEGGIIYISLSADRCTTAAV